MGQQSASILYPIIIKKNFIVTESTQNKRILSSRFSIAYWLDSLIINRHSSSPVIKIFVPNVRNYHSRTIDTMELINFNKIMWNPLEDCLSTVRLLTNTLQDCCGMCHKTRLFQFMGHWIVIIECHKDIKLPTLRIFVHFKLIKFYSPSILAHN